MKPFAPNAVTAVLKLSAVAVAVTAVMLLAGCGGAHKSAAVRDTYSIYKAESTCVVDGRADDALWKNAEAMGGFRIEADPERVPDAETSVRVSYGADGLYVLFECEEPDMARVLKEEAGPAGTLDHDNCELLVFSRPETPFYSPYLQRLDYKNANNAVRTQRRFMVDPHGGRIDSNIHKTGAHTAYITDDSWEGAWESAASATRRGYTVEIAVPWETIGGMPQPGHDFKLHFVRRRSANSGEILSFNWAKNENLYVVTYDPADFTQEHPQIFAPVVFQGDRAVLTRYVEIVPPWKIERTNPAYERVLTDRPMPYRAAHFYLGISGFLLPHEIRSRYDDATWKAEERNFFTEIGRAGMNGPFLPGFMNAVGVSGLDSLNAAYGMRFSWHGGASADRALKSGATMLRPGGGVAFFDPVFAGLKTKAIAGFAAQYGGKQWLFDFRGQDEPFNQISTLLMPETWARVDGDLRREYGVGLGVPAGVIDLPYQDQPVHVNSRGVPGHETALERIAMFRWLNKRFYEVAKAEYAAVRKAAPKSLYQAYNRNAVADMDFLDQSLVHDITDYYSADPYPSFCIYVYGTARSRYHVGFTSKFVTDLAAGKPTQMIIQGCDMIQRYSTPENVREWASQAAKTGAAMIDWWGTPRLDHPDLYREMLRVSNLWMKLPALDIPESPEIGVIFSDDSRAAAGDEALDAHYSLHVILGERLGAAWSIVSENHVRRGLHTLDGIKLLIAPQLGYVSREFAGALIDHVKAGATLVLLDPDAFRHDIETGPLSALRAELTGLGECPPRHADRMTVVEAGRARFGSTGDLPLRPYPIAGYDLNARATGVPQGAEVLYTYPDGEPAAFSRKLGAGEVIIFGAMPFRDSELAVAPGGWEGLFASVIDGLGIERGLPIWNFLMPATGGEVETFPLLVPELNR